VWGLKDSCHDQHGAPDKHNSELHEDEIEKVSPGCLADSDGLPHRDAESQQ
jgi:hypothetical protein